MAQYDANWVRQYYDEYGMKEWDRWNQSPVERIKFLIHLHHLQQHVRKTDRVLEIGAGAGRFTRELAKITKRIVVADISPGQLALNRRNASTHDFEDATEDWIECDMCELESVFEPEEFDVVVCYGGPLSYVFDRHQDALAQLRRVTKPEGKLLFSVMSLWGSVHQFLSGVFAVDIESNRQIIQTGNLTPDTVGPGRHYAHMFRSRELRADLEAGGLEILALSASNCLTTNWVDLLNEIPEDDPKWQHLIEMEIEACQELGCLDMGTHLIAVCRKPA
ncbi:class I SAM-dependent methyltransferase [Candidatus Bipolaricaulota bacterium]